MILQVTITIRNDTDYDNNPVSWKEASSTIDGIQTNVLKSYETSVTDPDITTDYEAYLTSLGYTWD